MSPDSPVSAPVSPVHRRRLEALLDELEAALWRSADADAMMAVATELLGTHLDASRCVYACVDDDGEGCSIPHEYRGGATEPGATLVGEWRLSAFGPRVVDTLRRGHTLVVHDVDADLPDDAAAFAPLGVRAFICAATRRDGRLVALMAVAQAEPRRWTTAEIVTVELVARRCWESIARARAALALTQIDHRFRTLIDQISLGLAQTDVTGRFTLVNLPYAAMLGYTTEELTSGMRVDDITPAEDLASSRASFEALIAGGPDFVLEKRYRRKDGRVIWVRNNVSALRDARGGIVGAIALSADITERRQAEQDRRFLSELGEIIRVADTVDTLLTGVTQLLREYLRVTRCDVTTIDAAAPPGLTAEADRELVALRAGRTVTYRGDLDRRDERGPTASDVARSWVIVPLRRAGQWGTAFRFGAAGSREWTAREIGLLEAVAERAWSAGEKLSVERTLRDREVEARFLAALSDGIWTAENTSELMRHVAHATAAYMGVDRCYVVEVFEDEDRCTIRNDYHGTLPSLTGEYRLSNYGIAVHAELRAGRTVAVEDAATHPLTSGIYERAYVSLAVRSFVHVPLLRAGRWVASVSITDSQPRRWSPRDVNLLQSVAKRAWLAIERLRLDAALRESDDRGRLSLTIARLGTWSWHLDTNEVSADARCRELCFLDPDARLTLADIAARVHPADWPGVEAALTGAARPDGEGRYAGELRLQHPDGRIHWVVAQGQMQFSSGSPRRAQTLLGSVLDITERKETEADLRRASHLKDEFLATLSHELRTPLNAVVGWVHLLRSGTLRKDLEPHAFASLERNAKAQVQLVDDLLDVSRIVSGKMTIASHPVDLEAVVRGALESVQITALAKKVSVEIAAPQSGSYIVLGDGERLRQVLWNLLSNAVKFTPAGGQVCVTLSRDGDDVLTAVRDSGQGIDAAFLPHVFERFRQADGTSSRRHGGLGLGLSIVKHLTEAHGGVVTVESPGTGAGATFTVRLPGVAAAAPQAVETAAPASMADLQDIRMLVVDDDADARDVMSALLLSHGAVVETVGTAAEALAAADTGRFDLVLADIGMPERDGYWLIREIRALAPPAGRVPCIALTAYASARDKARASEAGFTAHVAKPFKLDELLATIHQTMAVRA